MRLISLPAIVFSTAFLVSAVVQATERAQVPDKLKWSLSDLFASPEAWLAAASELHRALPALDKLRGHLLDSPQALFSGLTTIMETRRRASRLQLYATMRFDEDTRVSDGLARKQSAEQLQVELESALAWVRPEL